MMNIQMHKFVQTDAMGNVVAIVESWNSAPPPVHENQSEITGREDVTPKGTFNHATKEFIKK